MRRHIPHEPKARTAISCAGGPHNRGAINGLYCFSFVFRSADSQPPQLLPQPEPLRRAIARQMNHAAVSATTNKAAMAWKSGGMSAKAERAA